MIHRGSHTSLTNSPGKYQKSHQWPRRDSDDQVGREWLPSELSDSMDGSGKTVMLAYVYVE
jgi:hypothetical protein